MDGDVVVGIGSFQRRCHRLVHGARERILLVGAVDADNLHAAVTGHLDFAGHDSPLVASRTPKPHPANASGSSKNVESPPVVIVSRKPPTNAAWFSAK